jgi:hypothetical protein
MDSTIVAGVGGAVVGAVFTAGGTWWVSVRLDRQRENRRLIAAIVIVVAEIQENISRLAQPQDLTDGDWNQNKAAMAGLSLRNEDLWVRVRTLYGAMFEAKFDRAAVPQSDALRAVVGGLTTERKELEREIQGFSSLFR